MSKRTRIILVVIGLVMLLVSLAAIYYALSPVSHIRVEATLVPNLLTPQGQP
jgi:hypothetical protein